MGSVHVALCAYIIYNAMYCSLPCMRVHVLCVCKSINAAYGNFQFELLQAKLEAEVENLSWKIEKAEITDRGVRTMKFILSDLHRKLLYAC